MAQIYPIQMLDSSPMQCARVTQIAVRHIRVTSDDNDDDDGDCGGNDNNRGDGASASSRAAF